MSTSPDDSAATLSHRCQVPASPDALGACSWTKFAIFFAQDWLEKYWDIFVFVEGSIYQLDEANEDVTTQILGGSAPAVIVPESSDAASGARTHLAHQLIIKTSATMELAAHRPFERRIRFIQ